jgi:hypothetical protein
MAKKARDYRKEYDSYHAKPEQKKRRAERNRDRDAAEKKYGKAALQGKEVDHLGSHRKGSLAGVPTKIVSKAANRKRQPKRKG